MRQLDKGCLCSAGRQVRPGRRQLPRRLHTGRAPPELARASRGSQPEAQPRASPGICPALEPLPCLPISPEEDCPKGSGRPRDPSGGLTGGSARHRCPSPALGVGDPGQNLRRVFPLPPPNLRWHRPPPTVPQTRDRQSGRPCPRSLESTD